MLNFSQFPGVWSFGSLLFVRAEFLSSNKKICFLSGLILWRFVVFWLVVYVGRGQPKNASNTGSEYSRWVAYISGSLILC